jgi:hypothetical protein
MLNHPKLELIKYIFSRPTVTQAFGEVVVAVIKYLEDTKDDNPKQTVEQVVIGSIKEYMAEKGKDTT